MRLVASAILILLFFAVMQIFVLPPDGFMTGDQGAKYLQARAFAEQGPFNPAIELKSRDIDPEHAFRDPQLAPSRGRLVSVFMWLLPLITAPFLAVLGMRGLYVVPAFSAVVVFWCAARLGRRSDDRDGAITGLLVLVVTPIALYGLELWEHAPAAACVSIAAVLLMPIEGSDDGQAVRTVGGRAWGFGSGRVRFFAAGVVIVIGFLFREETVVALPALLIGRALSREHDRLRDLITAALWSGLGVLVTFVASMPMNEVVYGTLLPMHVTEEAAKSARMAPYFTIRADVVRMLFTPSEYPTIYVAALVAGIAVSIYATRRGPAARGALMIVHAAVLIALAIGVGLPLWHLAHGVGVYDSYNVASGAHTWVFALALLYLPWLGTGERRPVLRYLIASGVLVLFFTCWIVPSDGGAQWSPRYFLPVVTLFAIPAVEIGWSRSLRAAPVWAARTALAASVLMLATGIAHLTAAKRRFAGVTHGLAQLTTPGEIVITDVFWLPEVASTLAPTRRILFSWDLSDAPRAAALGVKAGFDHFTMVTYPVLTHRVSPDTIDVPGAPCEFVRGDHQYGLEIRGVVLSRYSCADR